MKRVHLIGGPETEALEPEIVGNKAANIAAMARMGLPVPPAFVLPVAFNAKLAKGKPKALAALDDALSEGIAFLEARTGRRFGDRRRPLLVSVRSGAARSMPGMLETVLDVGATEDAAAGLVRLTGNPRFALDCRRRFLEAYAETVLGIEPAPLARALEILVAAEGVDSDRDLDAVALATHVRAALDHVAEAGHRIPAAPIEQLRAAALAVFASWEQPKAVTYRKLHGYEDLEGTAVTVQAMVYGNADARSAAGVAFSRDPARGENRPVVELLFDAQGEDVVSGRRTPTGFDGLAARLPEVATRLTAALAELERAFRDVQDVEFTVERGELWFLQTRSAKRTPRAALTIAVDHVAEGLITPTEALARLDGIDEAALDETRFADDGATPIAIGVAASPGAAVGRIACDSEAAVRLAAAGDPVVLVRPDTSTADIAGFAAAQAIVTATGGRTAHAAVVARQMGRPAVVGCAGLMVDPAEKTVGWHDATGDGRLAEGEWISVDGASGAIFAGRRTIERTRPDEAIAIWHGWSVTETGHGRRRSARS